MEKSHDVNSQADINKAVEVARHVPGVKSVKNDMALKWRFVAEAAVAECLASVPGANVAVTGNSSRGQLCGLR